MVDEIIIGKRIKKRLYEIGMTQNELADKCYLSNTAISKYITHKSIPNAVMLGNIAEILGCSADYLLGIDGGK